MKNPPNTPTRNVASSIIVDSLHDPPKVIDATRVAVVLPCVPRCIIDQVKVGLTQRPDFYPQVPQGATNRLEKRPKHIHDQ